VVLVVTDSDGDEASDAVEVSVTNDAQPVVEIEADPSTGIEPLSVRFQANVAGGNQPLAYAWDFDSDGVTDSAQPAPSRVFQAGRHTVVVTVTDADGDSDSDTVTIDVDADTDPEVTATADPAAGQAPLGVQFDCQVAAGNAPFVYRWDFGDGQGSDRRDPSYTYPNAGDFVASCTVVDADGDEAVGTVSVQVVRDRIPTVQIQADPLVGITPLMVNFQAAVVGGDAPFTYHWSFGDGGEADTEAPGHVYEQAGTFTVVVVVTDADGDEATDTVEIGVTTDEQPVVEIVADPLQGIEPLRVQFAANVAGGNEPLTYAWDFDADGVSDSAQADPSRSFGAGTHAVTVVVTDANGDEARDEVEIVVAADTQPAVTATAEPASGQAPLGVQFRCQVDQGNEPLTYAWDFGDGQGSARPDPSYTYQQPGDYTAVCTVTDANGDQANGSVEVAVAEDRIPTVEIQADPLVGIAPLQVNFHAAVVGGDQPLTYSWSFGDGGEAATRDAAHTYEGSGTFTAILVVTDADGDEATDSVEIGVTTDEQPVVEISADRTQGIEPLRVNFAANVAGGNAPLTFAWDFDGDGEADSAQRNPERVFTAGNHTVTLTVTDADGDSGSDTLAINVRADTEPEVNASADPTEGQAPLGVQFQCAVAEGNGPFAYSWDFGDGQASDRQAPFYTYQRASDYVATCTVTDADGDQASGSVEVQVSQDLVPEVAIQADPLVGITPLQVNFHAAVAGGDGPFHYAWSFGDGGTADTVDAQHVYGEAGTFTVVLVVTDADGDEASDSVEIGVTTDEQPVVEITAEPRGGIAPLRVSFGANVAGGNPPLTYAWDFDGDGEADSALVNPTRTFGAGEHQVSLTVTDANGDESRDQVVIEVAEDTTPDVSVTADPEIGLAPLGVQLGCAAAGGNPPLAYRWDYGDGEGSALQAPFYTFPRAGEFMATCTVIDGNGDRDQASVQITVIEDLVPQVTVEADPIAGLAPLDVLFRGTVVSGNGPFTYEWIFGDGGTSDVPNPRHVYEGAGTYRATLRVTDSDGDEASASVNISVGDASMPAVTVGADPEEGPAPVQTALSCSAEGGNPPYTYAWSFGDGTNSDAQNPAHTYTEVGEYLAVCTVTDSFGQEGQSAVTVRSVNPNLPPEIDQLVITNGWPEPVPQHCAAVGQTMIQLNVAAHDGNDPPDVLAYEWVFDSVPAGSQVAFNNPAVVNPTFTPDLAGEYLVRINVRDGRGGSDSEQLTVLAEGPERVMVIDPEQPEPGMASEPYPTTLVGQVLTACGIPYANTEVAWEAENGSFEWAERRSDENGATFAQVRLGCEVEGRAQFSAYVPGQPDQGAVFGVPVEPGAPYLLYAEMERNVRVVNADGTPNAMGLTLQVSDVCGNPTTAGEPVRFNLMVFGEQGEVCLTAPCEGGGSNELRGQATDAGQAAFQVFGTTPGLVQLNVEVTAGQVQLAGGMAFSERLDFEGWPGDMEIGSLTGSEPDWRWGEPLGGAHWGDRAWATNPDGDYEPQRFGIWDVRYMGRRLQAPCIGDVPMPMYLHFWERHDFAEGALGYVTIDDPAADPFEPLSGYDGELDGRAGYAGPGEGWVRRTLDLSHMACQDFGVYWNLYLAAGADQTADGWVIDDVVLEAFEDSRADSMFLPGPLATALIGHDRDGVVGCESSPAGVEIHGFDALGNPVPRGQIEVQAEGALAGGVFFVDARPGQILENDGNRALVELGPRGRSVVLLSDDRAEDVEVTAIAIDGDATTVAFVDATPDESGLCQDGLDNDCNGAVDCADGACVNEAFCAPDLVPRWLDAQVDRGQVWVFYEGFNQGGRRAAEFITGLYVRPAGIQPDPRVEDPDVLMHGFDGVDPGEGFGSDFQFQAPGVGEWDIYLLVDAADEVPEASEDNNLSDPVRVLVEERLPNLSWRNHDAVLDGRELVYEFTWGADDGVPVEDCYQVAVFVEPRDANGFPAWTGRYCDGLVDGEERTEIIGLTVDPGHGHDVWFMVDWENEINEFNEDDNEIPPLWVDAGQQRPNLRARGAEVFWQGNSVQFRYWWENTTPTPVAPGQCYLLGVVALDPNGPPPEQYDAVDEWCGPPPADPWEGTLDLAPDVEWQVYFVLDLDDSLAEANEEDNTLGPLAVDGEPPQPLPNLLPGLSLAEWDEDSGGVNYTLRWQNASQHAALGQCYDVAIYAAPADEMPAEQHLVGFFGRCDDLAPFERFEETTWIRLPRGQVFDLYFQLDANDGVVESNEEDNLSGATRVRTGLEQLPDLTGTFAEANWDDGGNVVYSLAWTNQGEAPMGPEDCYSVAIFAWNPGQPVPDVPLGEFEACGPGGDPVDLQLPLPQDQPWVLGFALDWTEEIAESDEDNNFYGPTPVQGGGPFPNLVAFDATVEWDEEEALPLYTARFTNDGEAAVQGCYIVAMWSVAPGDPFDPSAPPADVREFCDGPNQGEPVDYAAYIGVQPGETTEMYFVVDVDNNIVEDQENDNVFGPTLVSGDPPRPRPNLTALDLDPMWNPDEEAYDCTVTWAVTSDVAVEGCYHVTVFATPEFVAPTDDHIVDARQFCDAPLPGEVAQLVVPLTPPEGERWNVYAVVDGFAEIDETNEDDNQPRVLTIEGGGPVDRPNLVVQGADEDWNNDVGANVLTYAWANIGQAPVEDCYHVAVFAALPGEGPSQDNLLHEEEHCDGLAVDTAMQAELWLDIPVGEPRDVFVYADPYNAITEIEEMDNVFGPLTVVGGPPPCVTFGTDFSDGFGELPWEIDGWEWDREAAMSANHEDGSDGVLRLALADLPDGTLSFRVATSSEPNFDELRFYLDGELVQEWSGEVPWTAVEFEVPAGDHVFEWMYSKDGSVDRGEDTAWIDDLHFIRADCERPDLAPVPDALAAAYQPDRTITVDFEFGNVANGPVEGCYDVLLYALPAGERPRADTQPLWEDARCDGPAPGEVEAVNIVGFELDPAVPWHFFLGLDRVRNIEERNEANNISLPFVLEPLPFPNLVADAVVGGWNEDMQATALELNWSNTGEADIPVDTCFWVGVFALQPGEVPTVDTPSDWAQQYCEGLEADSGWAEVIHLNLRSERYDVYLWVDVTGAIHEPNEIDNISQPVRIIGGPPPANLMPLGGEASWNQVAGVVDFTFAWQNEGETATEACYEIAVFATEAGAPLEPDMPALDVYLTCGRLEPGAVEEGVLQLDLPWEQTFDLYFLVDATDQVIEANEDDNLSGPTPAIGGPPPADLAALDLVPSWDGDLTNVALFWTNHAPQPVVGCYNVALWVMGLGLEPDGAPAWEGEFCDGLQPGEIGSVELPLDLRANTEFAMWFQVDSLDVLPERNEDDNVGGPFMVVGGEPCYVFFDDFSDGLAGLPWNNTEGWDGDGMAAFTTINGINNGAATLALDTDDLPEGRIAFRFRVSSEQRWDSLVFTADGQELGEWSGELGWQQASFVLPAGVHALQWAYTKDGSVDGGEDTVWLDDVRFLPSTCGDGPMPDLAAQPEMDAQWVDLGQARFNFGIANLGDANPDGCYDVLIYAMAPGEVPGLGAQPVGALEVCDVPEAGGVALFEHTLALDPRRNYDLFFLVDAANVIGEPQEGNNLSQPQRIEAPPLPDLVALGGSVAWNPDTQMTDFTAVWANEGDVPTLGCYTFTLLYTEPGAPVEEAVEAGDVEFCEELEAGAQTEATFPLRLPDGEELDLYFLLDGPDVMAEGDETNNLSGATPVVGGPPPADLRALPAGVQWDGNQNTYTFGWTNAGGRDLEGCYTVAVWLLPVDETEGDPVWTNEYCDPLPPGAEIVETLPLQLAEGERADAWMQIDVNEEIDEPNEDDNAWGPNLVVGGEPPCWTFFESFGQDLADPPWTVDGWERSGRQWMRSTIEGVQDGEANLTLAAPGLQAGQIVFRRAVSSELNYDFLEFYIDDVLVERWSGEEYWATVAYDVEAGDHTFTWRYMKDSSADRGLDRALVEEVRYMPTFCGEPPAFHCHLQWPEAINGQPQNVVTVFGRVMLEGVTDRSPATDPDPTLVAQLGWGDNGSAPGADWNWIPAEPNDRWVDEDPEPNDMDEYQADLVLPRELGEYDYAYRVSPNGGRTWTYCDLGLGSDDGYSAETTGALFVEDGPLPNLAPGLGEVAYSEDDQGWIYSILWENNGDAPLNRCYMAALFLVPEGEEFDPQVDPDWAGEYCDPLAINDVGMAELLLPLEDGVRYRAFFLLDATDNVVEGAEDDNLSQPTFVMGGAPRANLTAIDAQPNWDGNETSLDLAWGNTSDIPVQGCYTVGLWVVPVDEVPEAPFWQGEYCDTGAQALVEETVVLQLEPGMEYDAWLSVDATEALLEPNENDNVFGPALVVGGEPPCFSFFDGFEGGFGDAWLSEGWDTNGAVAFSTTQGQPNSQASLLLGLNDLTDGELAFRLRVSSEAAGLNFYDGLILFIDDVEVQRWSGEVEWSTVRVPLAGGDHVIEWRYVKDGSVDGGEDVAAIDTVRFLPADCDAGELANLVPTAPEAAWEDDGSITTLFAWENSGLGDVAGCYDVAVFVVPEGAELLPEAVPAYTEQHCDAPAPGGTLDALASLEGFDVRVAYDLIVLVDVDNAVAEAVEGDNLSARFTLTPPPLPNVRPRLGSTAYWSADANSDVYEIGAANIGEVGFDGCVDIAVYAMAPGDVPVGDTPPTLITEVCRQFDPQTAQGALVELALAHGEEFDLFHRVDPDDLLPESDELDNLSTPTSVIGGPLPANLRALDINVLWDGNDKQAELSWTNAGDVATEGCYTVAAFLAPTDEGPAEEPFWQLDYCANLVPGATIVETIPVPADDGVEYDLAFGVDLGDAIVEDNETDNAYGPELLVGGEPPCWTFIDRFDNGFGDRDWAVEGWVSNGHRAAADIAGEHNGLATLALLVEGVDEGVLSFRRKVSSEVGGAGQFYDGLRLVVDDQIVGEWAGELDWETIRVRLPAGDHLIEWRYVKDASLSRGQDTAWIDEVRFLPDFCDGPPAFACHLQWPQQHAAPPGTPFTATGQVYAQGFTDVSNRTDPHPTLLAQAGIGPDGTLPMDDAGWVWTDAPPNLEWQDPDDPPMDNDDEYQAFVPLPRELGPYDLAFRFSLNGGETWRYCDLDGWGNEYSVDQAGALEVVDGPLPDLEAALATAEWQADQGEWHYEMMWTNNGPLPVVLCYDVLVYATAPGELPEPDAEPIWADQYCDPLPADEIATATAVLNFPEGEAVDLHFVVDAGDTVFENNEDNNVFGPTPVLGGGPRPNLVPAGTLVDWNAEQGAPEVTFEVANPTETDVQGIYLVQGWLVPVDGQPLPDDAPIFEGIYEDVPLANDSLLDSFVVPAEPGAEYEVLITIDPANDLPELNEDDNRFRRLLVFGDEAPCFDLFDTFEDGLDEGLWTNDGWMAENGLAMSTNQGVPSSVASLSVTLQGLGEGVLSFRRRVSSEGGARFYDGLQLLVDDQIVGEWNGEVDWSTVRIPVLPGDHIFEWRYVKDNSVDAGEDMAWIDEVRYLPNNCDGGPLPNLREGPDGRLEWVDNELVYTVGWTNDGDADVPAECYTVLYYAMAPGEVPDGDTDPVDISEHCGGLEMGATEEFGNTLDLDPRRPYDMYFLLDSDNSVAETIEGDNLVGPGELLPPPLPNLAPANAGANWNADEALTSLNLEWNNGGRADVSADDCYIVGVWVTEAGEPLDLNQDAWSEELFCGPHVVGELFSANLLLDLPEGLEVDLHAVLDTGDDLLEDNEGDNVFAPVRVVGGPPPANLVAFDGNPGWDGNENSYTMIWTNRGGRPVVDCYTVALFLVPLDTVPDENVDPVWTEDYCDGLDVGAPMEVTLPLNLEDDVRLDAYFVVDVGDRIEETEEGDNALGPQLIVGGQPPCWTFFETFRGQPERWTFDGWAANRHVAHSTTAGENSTTATLGFDAQGLFDGQIVFRRRVSSEERWDYLAFFIDDVEVERWSGEQEWMTVAFDVAAGDHRFEWRYIKDNSVGQGDDVAVVDEIRYLPDFCGGVAPAFFCNLQWPRMHAGVIGTELEVFGRVYVEGITDRSRGTDPDAALFAEFGFGADGSSPMDGEWTWLGAEPNVQWLDEDAEPFHNDDEYAATFPLPAPADSYDYAYRFSPNRGRTWFYCDIDGNTGDNLEYSAEQAGDLTTQEPAQPNLAVSTRIVGFDGAQQQFQVRIRNNGDADVVGCHTAALWQMPVDGIPGEQDLPVWAAEFCDTPAAGETEVVDLLLDVDVGAEYDLWTVVDAQAQVPEADEADNMEGPRLLVGGPMPCWELYEFFYQMPDDEAWVVDGWVVEGGVAHSTNQGQDNTEATLSVEVDLSAESEIAFRRRVSSEERFDFLRFFIDGNEVTSWSGDAPLATFRVGVSAGPHVLSWVYSKDGSAAGGEDTAWIDDLRITPFECPPPDGDGDGFPDAEDNCPEIPNVDQTNSDNDTHGDVCDNCPLVDNEDQLDGDDDGIGDACDLPQVDRNLLFSEYVENGNSKAVEIVNLTPEPIQLRGCYVAQHTNGAVDPRPPIMLEDATLEPGQVFVLCYSQFPAQPLCHQTSGSLSFNGDDVLELACNNEGLLDSIGQAIGVDPGNGWIGEGAQTWDFTLRRNCNVAVGDRDLVDEYIPGLEWEQIGRNEFGDLGNWHCQP